MATIGAWSPYSQWGQDLWGSTPIAASLQFGNMPTGNAVTSTQVDPTSGLGWNADTLKMGLSGLNTLGNLWGAWQSNKLARDQLNFTKDVTNTNLNNSIKSYNDQISDRTQNSVSRTAYMRNQAEYDKRIADKQLEQKKL